MPPPEVGQRETLQLVPLAAVHPVEKMPQNLCCFTKHPTALVTSQGQLVLGDGQREKQGCPKA